MVLFPGVGPNVKPEVTIAKFLIHIIGAACSKYHQIVYSQSSNDPPQDVFLLQELSHLLLFVSYMFQSGRYLKVRTITKINSDGFFENFWTFLMLANVSQKLCLVILLSTVLKPPL